MKRMALICIVSCISLFEGNTIAFASPSNQAPANLESTTKLPTATTVDHFTFTIPQLTTVGDDQSIPYGVVTALAQDSSGLIWIGTQNGIVRYDGYRFRHFKHDVNDPFSLAGDYVRSIISGKDGKIWIGTESDGLSVFDPVNQRFENFSHDEKLPTSLVGGRVFALKEDANGGIWIGTRLGLDYLPYGKKAFTHYRHEKNDSHSLADGHVRSLMLDRMGHLWIGFDNGLQKFNGKRFTAFQNLSGKEVVSLFEAPDGKVWIGTRKDGAAWLSPDLQTLHWLPLDAKRTDALNHGWITGFTQVNDQIWLASYGGGITIIAANDGHILQKLRHDASLPSSLALDTVVPILLDNAGLLWIGTWGGSLQYFNTKNKTLRTLRHSPMRPEGLSHADIRSILELDDGRILMGSKGNGIDIFDKKRGLIGGYRTPNLPDSTVYSLAQTSDGSIWAGTQQAGVVRLKRSSTAWQSVSGAPGQKIQVLFKSKDGSLWAGTERGVAHWKPDQERFEEIKQDNGAPMDSPVYAMAEDGKGQIWIGSTNGLWLYEPNKKTIRGFHPEAGNPNALVSDSVSGLMVDHLDRLWLGTDKGLERLLAWDGKAAKFEHFSFKLGQTGRDFGTNMMEDHLGRIWTEFAVIDPDKLRVIELAKADGLDIGTSWTGSYTKTSEGYLLQGGSRGVAIINPAVFSAWAFEAPLVALDLKINGKPAEPGALKKWNCLNCLTLTLTPEQRNFSLEFSALDYSDPKKNRYLYRLQGYDTDWISTDYEHRNAAYGNLWPGTYTLQVRASNRLGDWSPYELNIVVHALPAYWQTWWFAAISIVGLMVILFVIFRWRTRRLKVLIEARTSDILKLGKIGQELTSTLNTEQAFERVYTQVNARLDAFSFSIGIYDEALQQINFVYKIENNIRQHAFNIKMAATDRPAVWCVRERRELIANRRKELLNFVSTLLPVINGVKTETVVYFPLLLENRVIGCLSVQSEKPNAYNKDQLEFLRALTSYTAIALSNSLAHGNLATTHQHLQDTQSQLVQAEKMASIGHLVANVAHEINTPISAVKSSGSNIAEALDESLDDMPSLFKILTDEEVALFRKLIELAQGANTVLNTREERALAREIRTQLEQEQIVDAEPKAAILTQLGAHQAVKEMLPLLHHSEADLILKTANSIGTIINNTNNINAAVARVSKIIFSLKAFVHNSNNGEFIHSDLRTTIEAVLTMHQTQIKHGIDLIRDFHEVAPLYCLPDELNQVWNNLIHNALQAMNNKGTLTISVHNHDNAIRVSIKDTGGGIPEAIRDKIFDAFFTTKAIGEGSGLGLNIVKKIIEKHHGNIQVRSEVGVGTTFIVTLPYREPPP